MSWRWLTLGLGVALLVTLAVAWYPIYDALSTDCFHPPDSGQNEYLTCARADTVMVVLVGVGVLLAAIGGVSVLAGRARRSR